MVLFNYATKELTAKVVYYGPGLCGKTTNLQFIYDTLPGNAKGKMLSLATKTDRTLFFDFLPIDLGTIRGMKTKIQLYTVPGQVFYDTTRKLVLKGADGVVFVADSQTAMLDANVDSFENLVTNLKEQKLDIKDMPHVIQYNKRDMKNVLPIDKLNERINRYNMPYFEAVAPKGHGVFDTLKGISKLVLKSLSKKYGLEEEKAAASRPAPSSGKKIPDLPPKPRAAAAASAPAPAAAKPQRPAPPPAPAPAAAKAEQRPARPAPPPPLLKKPRKVKPKKNAALEEIEMLQGENSPRVAKKPLRSDEPIQFEEESGPVKPRPKKPVLEPIPSIDDSEVIELNDVDPLEIEELDDMAEIADMASKSTDPEPASAVEPISVPISVNLPSSLGGLPLRLQIDISFED